jgi:hypothetical protein
MALPARAHTFALESCRDVLDKLEWEIEGLSREQRMPALAYSAFNCAVTAWHLADWVWKALPRRRQRTEGGEEKFKQACRDKCPALAHCWLIANASKHGGIDARRKKITAEVRADSMPARVGHVRAGETLAEYRWQITVADRPENERDAIDIFREAAAFWTELIYREQLD